MAGIKHFFSPTLFLRFFLTGIYTMGLTGQGMAAFEGAVTGLIEGSYTYTDQDQAGQKSSTRTFGEQYQLRFSRPLFDPRLGSFSAGGSFAEDQTDNSYRIAQGQGHTYVMKDYNFNLSLLPMSNPLTLYGLRSFQDDRFNLESHNSVDTYGFGWALNNIGPLPRVGVNGVHTAYNSSSMGQFPVSQSDYLTVDTGGKAGNYNLGARYLYNQTKTENLGDTWGHGVNLNMNGSVTPALNMGSYANLTTRGGNVSGANYFMENAAGVNLNYNPNKFWDGSYRADYIESPGDTAYRRYLNALGLNFHPTGKLDLFNNAQISVFDTGTGSTDSLFGSSAVNYRPSFGLTVTGGAGGGMTRVEAGGVETRNYFGSANGNVSYLKVLPLIRVTGGAGASLGKNHSPDQGETTDITTSVSGGVDNTQTNLIHVAVNGSFTQINRETPVFSGQQRETRISTNAETRNFRDLIFYADTLMTSLGITYVQTTGFGLDGQSLSEDIQAQYQFLGAFSLIGAYSHLEYVQAVYDNTVNTASINLLSQFRVWRTALWTVNLKELYTDASITQSQKTFDGSSRLTQQIGLMSLSAEYQFLQTETSQIQSVNQMFMVRAVRPF